MTGPADAPARRWAFGPAVLDERTLELVVSGESISVERKPLEVLLFLLHHAGEVVTKDEILEAVWPGRILSETVLTKCIAKIREALGDEDSQIIKTQHGYGYRLIAPVKVEASAAPPPPRFDFKPGDHPQGRPQWSLVERLGTGGHGEAWLARHDKTRESRVYKFALDTAALASLKREITIYRLLHDALPERSDFVRILDWNLEDPPYFLEAEHAGLNLVQWAESRGGLANVPLPTRLEIAARIADALAAAHSVGVLHKDLKPSNVLIVDAAPEPPQVKLSDFGSGGVLDPDRLEALGITRLGFTRTVAATGTTSGTPIYFAPEVIAGQPFTVQADIYALGVMLYQLVAGNLRAPLATGWERNIEDELLREDIVASTEGNLALRLGDAADLARRLRQRDERRSERASARRRQEDVERARAESERAQQLIERLRSRRRWLLGLVTVLLVGMAVSTAMYFYAQAARLEAEQSAAVTQAVVEFLTQDLLYPEDSTGVGQRDMTVRQALDRAAEKADRRFAGNPEVAAQVHMAVAWAYDAIGEPEAKARQLERAMSLRPEADGPVPDWKVALLFMKLVLDGGRPSDSFCRDMSATFRRGVQQTRLRSFARHMEVVRVICDTSAPPEVALRELDRIREDALRATPPDHELAGSAASALAAISYFEGDLEQAERYKRSEIEHTVASLGEHHRATIPTRATLVSLLAIRGRYEEAERELQQLQAAAGGDRFADMTARALARLRLEQDRLPEAERALMSFLLGGDAAEGRTPRERAYDTLMLAELQTRQRMPHEAVRTLRDALAAMHELGPGESISARDFRNREFGANLLLAEALRDSGDSREARAILATLLPGLRALPARHPLIADYRRLEGLLWLTDGQLDQARGALADAVDILDFRFGPAHWRTRRAREELARLPRGSGGSPGAAPARRHASLPHTLFPPTAMTTLADLLLAPKTHDTLVTQTSDWVERYVHASHGLRGVALKAGLAAAKAARPDAVPRAVRRLLPEFAAALEPFWQDFRATGERSFAEYLRRHAREASAAMMAATDVRIAASPNRALHSGYKRLRATLASELEKLLPDIARMIGKAVR